MRPEVLKVLQEKTETKELEEFRTRLKNLVKMSRDSMKDWYGMWDRNDRVYRGERVPDEQDRKAAKRGEPSKVFVPLTHTQVQTFVSFATTLLTSRDFFFELEGSGIEDAKPAKIAQALLERDLEYNKFKGVLLPQWLTDVARYGIGVYKTQWNRVTTPTQVMVPDPKFQPNPQMPTQIAAPMIPQWQERTKYLGNVIEVISPYRWFPDTRLPVTRYRDGEFCADENEKSLAELRRMERKGEVAGIDEIPRLSEELAGDRRLVSMTLTQQSAFNPQIERQVNDAYALITEVQIRLNPSTTFIAPNVALDPDLDAEIVYLVWIANDGRIIRIVDSGYEHNDFLYDAAQFFNDQSRLLNHGIAELIGPMQDMIDWFLNSRVTSIRKTIQNQLIVDPKNVEMQDLKDRNPVIRLKSTVPDGMSIDMFIKQLQVSDVTQGHVNDIGILKNFSEEGTGLQENLLGQYAPGRRSARESSNVNANGAARIIVPIKGLWESACLPLGKKMICNHRQGLDEEQLVRVIGVQKYLINSQPDPLTGISPVQAFLPVDKSLLVGEYDFIVFEGTLPSQRAAMANTLLQAGDTLMKNPRAVLALQIDPKLIFDEWLELNGIRNAERFRLTPQRLAELMSVAQPAGNAGGPPPPPGQGGGSGAPR